MNRPIDSNRNHVHNTPDVIQCPLGIPGPSQALCGGRWYNMDHTLQQVVVGTLCGIFLGCLAFAFRIEYLPSMQFTWATSSPSSSPEFPSSTTPLLPSPLITV
mmetsp:Transcript_23495/g.19962  ORF Transcript_23495/g.19962 Transcript_23495/m.19962 type:complete len:103 (-) Transcript_23495:65-373(-)